MKKEKRCKDYCFYYKGCEDCCFAGTEMCDSHKSADNNFIMKRFMRCE